MKFLKKTLAVLFVMSFILSACGGTKATEPAAIEPVATEPSTTSATEAPAVGGGTVIIGTPLAGETIGDERFDGETETAVFPGDLPADPRAILSPAREGSDRWLDADYGVMDFAPAVLHLKPGEGLPHIRLDKAAEFRTLQDGQLRLPGDRTVAAQPVTPGR